MSAQLLFNGFENKVPGALVPYHQRKALGYDKLL